MIVVGTGNVGCVCVIFAKSLKFFSLQYNKLLLQDHGEGLWSRVHSCVCSLAAFALIRYLIGMLLFKPHAQGFSIHVSI